MREQSGHSEHEDAAAFGPGELERAIDRGELHLVYQPWMDLTSASYSTVEALVRWNHPTRGPIGPVEFIPAAERSGLIVRLGAWVIEEACHQLGTWQKQSVLGGSLRMAINVSAHQLSPELVATVACALMENELDPGALCVEVTESTLMVDYEASLGVISALRALGVDVAVDDFGTGYSSLAQLKRLPVDVVKIPREFVVDLADDPRDGIILTAVTQMAHSLGMRVVAEGVETIWQAIAVRALGVELVQGYFFSPPRGAADIPDVLESRSRSSRLLPPSARPGDLQSPAGLATRSTLIACP